MIRRAAAVAAGMIIALVAIAVVVANASGNGAGVSDSDLSRLSRVGTASTSSDLGQGTLAPPPQGTTPETDSKDAYAAALQANGSDFSTATETFGSFTSGAYSPVGGENSSPKPEID